MFSLFTTLKNFFLPWLIWALPKIRWFVKRYVRVRLLTLTFPYALLDKFLAINLDFLDYSFSLEFFLFGDFFVYYWYFYFCLFLILPEQYLVIVFRVLLFIHIYLWLCLHGSLLLLPCRFDNIHYIFYIFDWHVDFFKNDCFLVFKEVFAHFGDEQHNIFSNLFYEFNVFYTDNSDITSINDFENRVIETYFAKEALAEALAIKEALPKPTYDLTWPVRILMHLGIVVTITLIYYKF